MFKLNKNNSTITYKVFKEGNIVKACLSNTEGDAYNIIDNVLNKANTKCVSAHTYFNVILPENYKASARCNVKGGDAFNEEYGKELARSRVLERYHRDIHRYIRQALEDLRVLVATMEHYCDKHDIDYSEVASVEELKANRFSANVNKN